MNQFGRNGYVVGSVVKIVSCFDKSLLGTKHTIVMPQQFHLGLKRWMYGIDLHLAGCNSSWVEHHQIELVSLPFVLDCWARNKVTLLLAHNDTIAADLALERRQQGDWK